jgi:hypothetical protein
MSAAADAMSDKHSSAECGLTRTDAGLKYFEVNRPNMQFVAYFNRKCTGQVEAYVGVENVT